MFNLYLRKHAGQYVVCLTVMVGHSNPPFIVDSLDDETESRADGVDILAHDLLDNGRLARIV